MSTTALGGTWDYEDMRTGPASSYHLRGATLLELWGFEDRGTSGHAYNLAAAWLCGLLVMGNA